MSRGGMLLKNRSSIKLSSKFKKVYNFLPARNTVVMTTATPIVEGAVAVVVIDMAALTAGTTYQVKLVGVDNTQLVFSVKAD